MRIRDMTASSVLIIVSQWKINKPLKISNIVHSMSPANNDELSVMIHCRSIQKNSSYASGIKIFHEHTGYLLCSIKIVEKNTY